MWESHSLALPKLRKHVRILGVSCSPREGNTMILVRACLLGAKAVGGVDTEFISLAGKAINPCNGCEACMKEGECIIQDDMTQLYPRLLAADAIVVGTPVYYGTVSGLCKAFLERVEGFGVEEKKLRLKVGGAIAVAASQSGGREMALMAIHTWCHINDMIPIGITTPASQLGVTGIGMSSDPKAVRRDRWNISRTGNVISATESAWLYGRKIATVTKIIKAGLAVTNLDLPDRPYGQGQQSAYPPELYEI